MSMERRDLFKLAGVAAAASVVTGCATGTGSAAAPASFIKKHLENQLLLLVVVGVDLLWLKRLENKINQLR